MKLLRAFFTLCLTAGVFCLSTASRAQSPPEEAYVLGVAGHAQKYTISCESRSAVDWAAFWGASIDETEFLEALPRSDNPDAGYVGQPNDPWGNIPPLGYGVHAGPVAALLREYGLTASAQSDLSWDDLRTEIATGRPVIVWVVGQMWAGQAHSYTAEDGSTTEVVYFEHTMILTGYSASTVQVVDAYSGWTQTYSVDAFLASWEVLGNMAILGDNSVEAVEEQPVPQSEYQVYMPGIFNLWAVQDSSQQPKEKGAETKPATKPERSETYTVEQGDYLIAVADELDLDWRQLAELNQIYYPFVIYPGQELKLR